MNKIRVTCTKALQYCSSPSDTEIVIKIDSIYSVITLEERMITGWDGSGQDFIKVIRTVLKFVSSLFLEFST